jgi:glycosyltransferase involved in cell wall biosynthesis
MKVSVIIPVLNSHEVVRRQILHFEEMGIPEDTEVIFVDDGSSPPITTDSKAVTIIQTNDFRDWTWPIARNFGAKHAKGEYYIFADLDHIVSKEIIDTVRNFTGDFVRFHREFGILDEQGSLVQDRDVLRTYGLPDAYDIKLTPHRNQFATHRDLYWKMGGFREDRIGLPYPQREDGDFAKLWRQLHEKGEVRDFDEMHGWENRPTIYMFPNGKWCGDVDFNPFNLFHKLSRKTEKNKYYTRCRT